MPPLCLAAPVKMTVLWVRCSSGGWTKQSTFTNSRLIIYWSSAADVSKTSMGKPRKCVPTPSSKPTFPLSLKIKPETHTKILFILQIFAGRKNAKASSSLLPRFICEEQIILPSGISMITVYVPIGNMTGQKTGRSNGTVCVNAYGSRQNWNEKRKRVFPEQFFHIWKLFYLSWTPDRVFFYSLSILVLNEACRGEPVITQVPYLSSMPQIRSTRYPCYKKNFQESQVLKIWLSKG